MEITTWQEAKELIRKRLADEGYSVEEKENDKATFHLSIDYPLKSAHKQDIVQPKDAPILVAIGLRVGFSQEHVDRLRKMDLKTRERTIWSVQKELIFNENNYKFERDSDGIPISVIFFYNIYFDGLTMNNLYRALNINYKSFLYLSTELDNRLGGTSTSNISSMYG